MKRAKLETQQTSCRWNCGYVPWRQNWGSTKRIKKNCFLRSENFSSQEIVEWWRRHISPESLQCRLFGISTPLFVSFKEMWRRSRTYRTDAGEDPPSCIVIKYHDCCTSAHGVWIRVQNKDIIWSSFRKRVGWGLNGVVIFEDLETRKGRRTWS